MHAWQLLAQVNVTEDEALGALTNHKVAEDKRRELIRLRFEVGVLLGSLYCIYILN
jgi:hypothetical protein